MESIWSLSRKVENKGDQRKCDKKLEDEKNVVGLRM